MTVSDNFEGLIKRVSDSFMRDNIYMIDKNTLAKALMNIDPQCQEKVYRNMTDDGADIKRMMGGFDNVSAQEIESAQQQILSLASQVV